MSCPCCSVEPFVGQLCPEHLTDYLIDDCGLVRFIDTQQTGLPEADWQWDKLASLLAGFSRGHLTFSGEYLRGLYEMQKERVSA